MASAPERTFKSEVVRQAMGLYFKGKRTRVTDEAVQLVAEVISLAAVEATLRAGKQAKTEAATVIQPDHLEKVLPQLILDL